MELYIIRHGETDWNKEKRLQGRSDTELNEYGIELAEITADALKDVTFDRIYSSPLKRAYRTAEIIRLDRDIEIQTDDRLLEICFGVQLDYLFSHLQNGKLATLPYKTLDEELFECQHHVS